LLLVAVVFVTLTVVRQRRPNPDSLLAKKSMVE